MQLNYNTLYTVHDPLPTHSNTMLAVSETKLVYKILAHCEFLKTWRGGQAEQERKQWKGHRHTIMFTTLNTSRPYFGWSSLAVSYLVKLIPTPNPPQFSYPQLPLSLFSPSAASLHTHTNILIVRIR